METLEQKKKTLNISVEGFGIRFFLKHKTTKDLKDSIAQLTLWGSAVPVQAATMSSGGEEEVWLAQGEALRDPRPDVPHLLHGDDLRGEVVRIESQLHILSVESREMANLQSQSSTYCW